MVGDTGSFRLIYTNTGNLALTGIAIADEVNPLLAVQSVTSVPADLCGDSDSNAQTVECQVDTLSPGDSVEITVDFKPALPLVDDFDELDSNLTSGANYVFYFENGYVLYGSTTGGVAKLVGPDGEIVDAVVDGRNQDIYFTVPFGGDGFQLHLSCSELFINGWGTLGPLENEDADWRIVTYDIDRFNVSGNFKDCGQTFGPIDVDNKASATAQPPDGTTLTPNPIFAEDSVSIIGAVPIDVTRERVRRGAVEIQYVNTSQDEITLATIVVTWTDGDELLSASYQGGVKLDLESSSPADASVDTVMPAGGKDWLKLNFASNTKPENLTVTFVTDSGSAFTYRAS